MAVTITVTSPTGSEFNLEDWLLNANANSPVATNTGEYQLASTGTFLGSTVELIFQSSGNDLTYDGVYPDGGLIDGLQIFSVGLNMVVVTITGFNPIQAEHLLALIFSNPVGNLIDALTGPELEYFGDDGGDSFAPGANAGGTLIGGKGDDVLKVGAQTNVNSKFEGGEGNDTLVGGGGMDILEGGEGNDTLIGLSGSDKLDGGDGDDVLRPGAGANQLFGGDKFDTADYSDLTGSHGVLVDAAASTVTKIDSPGGGLDTFDSIEKFVGSKNDDIFINDGASRLFEGGEGNDQIFGGSGDDWATGGAGADLMDGGAGLDTLSYLGSATGITVTLGAPNAWTTAKGGDAQGDKFRNFESVIGSDGNDKLTGNNLDNRLFGTKGDDTLLGSGGNDRLNGGEGKDTLDGGTGDDLLEGGESADKITGGTGIDTVSYENSFAPVTVNLATNVNTGGDASGDTLFTVENVIGSGNDDTITGNALDNIIEGGAGADTIAGGGGKDTASYASSQDGVQIDLSIGSAAQTSTGDGNGDKLSGILHLIGSGFADKLTGDTGDNTIEGGADADELDGGAGIDTLSYASSNGGVGVQLDANGAGTGSGAHAQGDTYKNFENITGSTHDDVLAGNNIANVLKGGAGNDFIEGYGGADIIDGGDGVDGAGYEFSDAGVTVNLATNVHTGGHAQGDKLASVENVYGSDFKDKLTGNSLANELNGSGDDDYIDGGSGNDKLYGGNGNDTILGNSGDDLIDGGGDADVMDGGSGIDTLSYSASGAVKVKLGEGSTAQIQSAATKVTVNGVADIELGGGEAEGDSVKNFESLIGSAFNDVLVGNGGANKIEGGLGKDNIDGGKGNDNILGGFGDDNIFGGDGDDVIEGGAGADKMDGGLGKNTLSYADDTAGVTVSLMAGAASGGDGAGDTFMNFQNARGGSGDDFITGDGNANVLEGGNGDDTLFGNGGKDILDGGVGFDFASFEGVTKAVTVALKANGASTTVTSLAGAGSAAGTTLKNIEGLIGSDFNDKLTGNASGNKIDGLDGDDWIEGGAGADEFNGGNGIDTLSYAGSKAGVTVVIDGGNITPNSGGDAEGDKVVNFENLVGSKFDDYLAAQSPSEVNVVKGGAGNDVIQGGGGGDMLFGEAGSDTLSYATDNAGVTVILKGSAAADVSGSTAMGNHAAGDVATGFENLHGGFGKDMLVGDAGANVIDGGGGGDDILDSMGGIDTVSYASASSKVTVKLGDNGAETTGNGTAGENDSIKNFENIAGSSWNDTLYGNNLANVLSGGNGDDILIGGGGADKLDGGDGLDTADYSMLAANHGITVTLGKDGKAATVSSPTGSPAKGDVLINIESIKGGAGSDKLTGNNLQYILDGGDGDDWLEAGTTWGGLHGGNGNDTASFSGYSAIVIANLETSTASGGFTISGFENLVGSAFNDTLTGDAGVNRISGGAGNDSIRGGDGADILDGGSNLSTSEPQLIYGDIVNYSDIAAGTDLVIVLGNNGAKTVVTATGVDASFANGEEIMNFESVEGGGGNDKLTGNAGNNTIRGGDGDDWIEGGAGNDLLNGGNGINTVAYATATAGVTVSLALGGYQDTVGAGKDFIQSFTNLVGSAKNDRLTGDFQANLIEGGDGNDVIEGGQGGDTLKGGNGIDTVSYAGAQSSVTVDLNLQDGAAKQSGIADENNDVLTGFENLTGGEWHDKLTGDVNSNTIFGLGGNDTINGGRGADILDGGDGIDTLSYADDNNAVTVKLGLNGAQTLATGDSHSAGDKVSNFENVTGGSGNDILTGNNLDNTILGGDGDDIIDGGLGDDFMDGQGGVNTLSYASVNVPVTVNLLSSGFFQITGAGNDYFQNFQNLVGSSKDDLLSGNHGNNVIEGGAGNDTLSGFNGNDVLEGGAGNDIIDGGANSDTVSYKSATAGVTVSLAIAGPQNTKGAGTDTLISIENLLGSKFNDMLTGDDGNNKIESGAGNDILFGGKGDDTLDGGAGNDIIDGGSNHDTVSYASATAGVTVDLQIGAPQNTVGAGTDTLISIESILGSAFDDKLTGNGLGNTVDGGGGNDILTGFGAADTLIGGDGDDVLIGDNGIDILTGGDGNDVFHFHNNIDLGDIIVDFTAGDTIRINRGGFNIPGSVTVGGAGADDFAAEYFVSGSGAVATKAHGQFVFDTDTFELYWDDDGTGGNAAVLIAEFDNGYNLQATDFILT